MQKKIKRALILTLGVIFILLGLIGSVLPFVQGFILLAVGIILISFYSPKIRLWIEKHTEKYPHLSGAVKKLEKWIIDIIGEI
ncbi:hypothetical protein A2818_01120 [Candidatus Nomurabacteria bacterium RIFCSPHIGHO2_01_FULL_40_12]|uniref:DUF454 domain-containing protein n=1 Tax=Candidatus Nomurabacteria bacterium RIFCSPHIGHO2_01_FULL_40_12 TaxID=1801737 RepID=A0A1F6UYJ2_9BACT|nr:MAG: hypothetical protein A2818_01120 [Candidatus Nomurabacteria bacterium RIFCSPHIGHO2_01_FULL_40_12]